MDRQRARSDNTTRKRKRPPQDHSDGALTKHLGLPDIPGIPMEILPLHVQAIKVVSTFFRQEDFAQTQVVSPFSENNTASGDEPPASATAQAGTIDDNDTRASGTVNDHNVMDRLWNRIEQTAIRQEEQSDQGRERIERVQQREQIVKSWLQSIHRWMRDHNQQKPASSSSGQGRDQQPQTYPQKKQQQQQRPPISALRHLMDIIVTSNTRKLWTKRAATYLAGRLFEKSSDCRKWWIEKKTNHQQEHQHTHSLTGLMVWMDHVAAATSLNTATAAATIHHLWQCESYLLLHHLEQRYGDFYPTLRVALQRLQQLCPQAATRFQIETSATSAAGDNADYGATARNVADQRRIRDVAMQYYEKEEVRVQTLLDRAHACIDILVPRMDAANSNPTGSEQGQAAAEVADADALEQQDDDSDNDSVNWEDGMENGEQETDATIGTGSLEAQKIEAEAKEDHAAAVERTLAIMESTGGVQGGELEIIFSDKPQDDGMATAGATREIGRNEQEESVNEPVRQRFKKVVQKLSFRHLPRLSSWVDCLTQTDNLIQISQDQQQAATGMSKGAASSLVRMPEHQILLRKHVLVRLTSLKQQVASLLQSAERLRLKLDSQISSSSSRSNNNNNLVVNSTRIEQVHANGNRGRSMPLRLAGAGVTMDSGSKHYRNQSLEQNINNQQRRLRRLEGSSRRGGSNRIQIKYRKSH